MKSVNKDFWQVGAKCLFTHHGLPAAVLIPCTLALALAKLNSRMFVCLSMSQSAYHDLDLNKY